MDAVAAGANDLGLVLLAMYAPRTEQLTLTYSPCNAHACRYPSVSAGMFERGAVELVWHVVRKANTHMSESLESMDLASIPVNERVKAGVQARLTYLARYHKAWPQAMALALQPAALPETLQLLAVAADEIWYWAGDRSTDLNWYTRRLLLMGVMATTETAMLTDRTPGHVETWEFLDRRLQDVSQFGRSVGDSLSMLAAAAGGLGSLANAAFDIIRPVIVRDGPLPTGPVPRGAAAYGAGAGASAGVHSGSQARPASPAWPAGLPASPAEGVAQAAAAAASVAQAVASQAATVAAATGVRLPDPSVVLGALSTFLPRPPRGGIPPPTGFASRGPGAPGAAPPGPVFPHATGGGVTEPVTFPSPPGTGTPNGPVQV